MGDVLDFHGSRATPAVAASGMEPFHTGGILALNAAVAALLVAVPDRARLREALAAAELEAQVTLDGLAGHDGGIPPEAVGYRVAMRMFHEAVRQL